MNRVARFLQSPANWCGLALATVGLVLRATGIVNWAGLMLAPLGYLAGFAIGGMWLGFPSRKPNPWDDLEFADQGDARAAMANALSSVRQLVSYNPDNRLSASLQARVLELCKQMEMLVAQWERSKGSLSFEEGFHARHIALSYLPDALKTYLSIPRQFAATKVLSNGRTAEETFKLTVDDLSGKVLQLHEDLASQDAQAFLNHSRFLHEKFAGSSIKLPQPGANPGPADS